KAVATSVLVPLLAGVAVRAFAPSMAVKISRPLSIIATVVLIAACIPVLLIAWSKLIAEFGDFTLVAIVLLVLVGLAVGHLLGGPDPGNRTALALSTASRHPGVAIAAANAISPHDMAVTVAVLFAFLVATIVANPYTRWRKRAHAEATSS